MQGGGVGGRMRNQHWRALKMLFRRRQLRVIVQFKHADSGCKRVEKFHVTGRDSRKNTKSSEKFSISRIRAGQEVLAEHEWHV